MARNRRLWLGLAVALLLLGVIAVSREVRKIKETLERLRFNQELLCVALSYHQYAETHGKSPSRLNDIEADRERFPQAYEMIRDGTFLVRWNAKHSGDGAGNDKYVLGYAVDAPAHGGWVLMGGGGREQVAASEFLVLPLIPVK